MKKLILLLLCITSSVAAMDLGQSFYVIHIFLQKKFSRKTKPNNLKNTTLSHRDMSCYIGEFITEPEESTKKESE